MSTGKINIVVISGNLTRDPELRATPGGASVAKLRVAVNGRRKDSTTGEWVDKPNYFDVVVWGKQGENAAKYLEKGRGVVVEGRLDWREWESKEGGGKRQSVEIVANFVEYVPTGKSGEAEKDGGEEASADSSELDLAGVGAGGGDDDIPF
ncbi:MAG TPA: single-stranded DNA-binding protein [Solirubrobacterales bacterium]